eukprot:Ihof_evm28s12 gene=Ihof_evmTU28s12
MSLLRTAAIRATELARNQVVQTTVLKALCVQQLRRLSLHEYQSKDLMGKYGVSTDNFRLIEYPSQARAAATSLGTGKYVVKAQIHAGGRGKGSFDSGLQGGVKVVQKPEEVERLAQQMLGYHLKTKQTTGNGVLVRKLMISEAANIIKETYLAIVMDRTYGGPVLIASPEGGMDIEEVAATSPDKIFKIPVDIKTGITHEQVLDVAKKLEFTGDQIAQAADVVKHLYEMFVKVDATQIEINPLGQTAEGQVKCFDAKINIDDNAVFRQEDLFQQRDTSEEDSREIDAGSRGLNFVGMEGNIGCMVNGAGLAMATMDIIKLHGGTPANFLDLGGGVTEESVSHAFKILTQDKQVHAILVNIFGGIVDCALVARGIIGAARKYQVKIPIVVRLK